MEKNNPQSIRTTQQNPIYLTRQQEKNMESQIQRVHSYVTADKIREHAEQVAILANSVSQVSTSSDPRTVEVKMALTRKV